MRMRFFVFLTALLLPLVARAQPASPPPTSLLSGPRTATGPWTFNPGIITPAVQYDATAFGSCTWDAAHDVGACINLAIAAAASAGGGTVVIPAGTYGLSTQIAQNMTGVHIAGAGVGIPRDNASSGSFLAVTKLVWIGAADGTMAIIQPTGSVSLYSADVTGITFDCASLADVCIKIVSVSASTINIGVSEPRVTGAWLTTSPTLADAPGTQLNDIWISARSTSAVYAPTGILIDGNQSGNFNVSYNHFHELFAWYRLGDGIVFGDNDSNLVDLVTVQPYPGATGSPVIVASPGYVMPSGGVVSSPGPGTNMKIVHTAASVALQGYTVGSTVTPGSNTGSAAVTPVTLTTNSLGSGRVMNYASTSGVGIGMDFSCVGGPSSGQPNHSVVARMSSTTIEPTFDLNPVASGVACTFNYGVTAAAHAGTYTITATAGTTYNITAPSGGHSQTGVSVSGGVLSFTDVVLPMTGSASIGDTFTLVVPNNVHGMEIGGVDSINGIPAPYFAPGATGSYDFIGTQVPIVNPAYNVGLTIPFGLSYCQNLSASSTQANAVMVGVCNGANSGSFAFVGGGNNNTLTNYYEAVIGGTNNTLSGIGSRAGGIQSGDHGRTSADCWSAGAFATQGDAQSCQTMMRGSGATASAFPLTVDNTAANSANCVNPANNSAFAITITLVAIDHTTVTKNETWLNWSGLLTRNSGAATTLLTMQATPTPLSNGVVSGSAISATADTTNGCLALTFTPPSGNTDTWNAVARVTSTEVQ